MYKEHPTFYLPKVIDNQSVWRYMDFWKFEDLIKSKELYTASINQMGDEYEFTVPKVALNRMRYFTKKDKGEEYARALDLAIVNLQKERIQKEIYISSWNYHPNESYALWKIYTSNLTKDKKNRKISIAIKSSIDRLKRAFIVEKDHTQYIGLINYHNGKDYPDFAGNLFSLALNKWDYYSFENEIRVICNYPPRNNKALKTHPEGLRIKVNLDELIDSVYLAPNAEESDFEFIQDFLEINKLQKDIYISGIRDKWANK